MRLNGCMAISSSGERRIKGLYAAGAVNAYVVAALVIGLDVLGGAVVSAVEDLRKIVVLAYYDLSLSWVGLEI